MIFYQNSRVEIDFIVDKKTALEVKLSASRQDIENLKRRANAVDISEKYIVTLKYSDYKESILAVDL